jgi:hypothetical protein
MMTSLLEDWKNEILREVRREIRLTGVGIRFGIVQQYDPSGPTVRLQYLDTPDANGQPTLSTPMPIIVPSAGPGSGVIAAPAIGTQAIVLQIGAGAEQIQFMLGVVRPTATQPAPYQSEPAGGAPPPTGAPEQETWMVHPNGNAVKMSNDGHIYAGAQFGTFQRMATEAFVLSVFNNHTHEYIPGSGTPAQTMAPNAPVPSGSTTAMTVQFKGT